jgi:hypothetical protein
VPSRKITDNNLIAFECDHAIQKGNRRHGDYGTFKLDLSKAYDRVDWDFLQRVMEKLGFYSKFIMCLLCSV